MKKIPLFVLLACLFCQASAQLSKGSLMIGGSVNFSRNNEVFSDASGISSILSTSAGFSPRAGLMLSEKSMFGVSIMYNEYGYRYDYPTYHNEYKQQEFAAGPLFRQYFPLGERAAFFLQGLALFKIGKTTNSGGNPFRNDVKDTNGLSVSISPGVNYFLNDRWALEATLGSINYSTLNADASDNSPSFGGDSKLNNVNFNLGFSSFTLGINYIIKR